MWTIDNLADGRFQLRRDLPFAQETVSLHTNEAAALREISALYAIITEQRANDTLDSETAAKAPSGANAPYKIVPRDGKYVVVNNTGAVKATFDDRNKALAYLRSLYMHVPGAAKRAAKTPFTGKAKDRVK